MSIKKDTLYWSVYKNLERETIDLSRQIHFDENQLSVYSIKIVELLIRCSVEIESIAKDLYFQYGGTNPTDNEGISRDLYFDTDCLEYLENTWSLGEKVVLVTATSFYFEKDENIELTPMNKANKRGSSGCDWKKAYQAVKHNRSMNLSKGNVKNLIRAMAALYLLNIYYRNENYSLGIGFTNKLENSLNSEMFSIKSVYVSFNDGTGCTNLPKEYKECVYIEKYTDYAYKKIILTAKEDFKQQKETVINSVEFNQFISTNPHYSFKDKDLLEICQNIGGDIFMRKIFQLRHNTMRLYENSQREAILNRNQNIYPDIEE